MKKLLLLFVAAALLCLSCCSKKSDSEAANQAEEPAAGQFSVAVPKTDDFVKEVLGESIYEKFLEAKIAEWKDFRTCVTQWEIGRYLNLF